MPLVSGILETDGKISEKTMPEVTAWQNRPLEPVYPVVFMDAIHYKVREDRRYVTKAAYVVLDVTMDDFSPAHGCVWGRCFLGKGVSLVACRLAYMIRHQLAEGLPLDLGI